MGEGYILWHCLNLGIRCGQFHVWPLRSQIKSLSCPFDREADFFKRETKKALWRYLCAWRYVSNSKTVISISRKLTWEVYTKIRDTKFISVLLSWMESHNDSICQYLHRNVYFSVCANMNFPAVLGLIVLGLFGYINVIWSGIISKDDQEWWVYKVLEARSHCLFRTLKLF
jgi:hypothetical protein